MHSRNVHVPELEHGIGAFLSAAEPNVFRLTKGTLQKRISDSKESSSSNSSNSQNQTEHETIKVLSLNDAFQTVTSQTVVVLVIVMSYLSVMCLGLCMPLFAAVPGGFFDEDGLFKFISIGFKQHTVLASIVYGLAMPCISFMRFLAIIVYVTSPFRALLYTILQMICMGAGIVTVRYDATPMQQYPYFSHKPSHKRMQVQAINIWHTLFLSVIISLSLQVRCCGGDAFCCCCNLDCIFPGLLHARGCIQ
jgi:hypothetical protein